MKTIYGLRVSDGPIRYIGQTKLSLEERRKLWVSNSRAEHRKAPVYEWVREITASGKQLQIVELEMAERFDEAESEWIARTPNLLNIAKGGPGCPGVIPDEKTRNKRSESVKNHWKTVINRTRWVPTEEVKEKQSMARKIWWEKKKNANA